MMPGGATTTADEARSRRSRTLTCSPGIANRARRRDALTSSTFFRSSTGLRRCCDGRNFAKAEDSPWRSGCRKSGKPQVNGGGALAVIKMRSRRDTGSGSSASAYPVRTDRPSQFPPAQVLKCSRGISAAGGVDLPGSGGIGGCRTLPRSKFTASKTPSFAATA